MRFYLLRGCRKLAQKIEKKTQLILYGQPIWKGLLKLAIPVFLVNVLKTLHDLVDGVFLGQIPDVDGVSVSTSMQSAIALTWPVYFIFLSLGMGLSVAGSSLIGQYIGRNDPANARKYAMNTVVLSLLFGLFFNAFLYVMTPTILRWMNASGHELEYATTYLRIRSFEMPVLFLSFAFQAVRQATGDTLKPVLINSYSILINIVLTPILILGYQMGIRGAAISTLVSHLIMFPFIIVLFFRATDGILLQCRKDQISLPVMRHITKIAIPASMGQAIQALGFVILNSLIYSFGKSTSAAFYIGNRINSLIMFPVSSVSAIMAIYIAQNVGAGNIIRVRKSFRSGMFLAITMMTIGVLFIIPFRFFLVGLFNHNPETIVLAAEYTLYLHLGLPLMAVFQTFLSTFQGSGDTKYAFALAVIRLWIFRLPLVILSMKLTDLGPAGIWYAILASNVLIIFVGIFFYKRVRFIPKIEQTGLT